MALFNVSKLHKLLWLNVSLTATANIWYIGLRLKAVMYVSDPFERRAIMSDKRIRILAILLTVLLAAALLIRSVSALRGGGDDPSGIAPTPTRLYDAMVLTYLLINLCAVTYTVRTHHLLPPAKAGLYFLSQAAVMAFCTLPFGFMLAGSGGVMSTVPVLAALSIGRSLLMILAIGVAVSAFIKSKKWSL